MRRGWIPAFAGIPHVGLSAHTTTDESWRAGRAPFAGLGGVGSRVKHEDDGGDPGGDPGEDFRSNDGGSLLERGHLPH